VVLVVIDSVKEGAEKVELSSENTPEKFLEGNSKGSILTIIGLRGNELTPRKSAMYKADRNNKSKLRKGGVKCKFSKTCTMTGNLNC
jgi:hypothetical protein